ncbi:MAG TPA: ATP-binding cassette domain-containing protein [Steroidobacteraceae bacterium]|jgi:ATP-binding cassette subfamily F protein 3|nr:ATP-binding cassette domain-containing protein [Steroidobacteraceae bacterium]
MLIARDLTLRRGPQPLFERVDFTVFRGNKLGITGANGTGKSSLFAAILGRLAPDRGEIELPAAIKTAHVEQEVEAGPRPAIEFVLDGDAELRQVQAAIEDAERRNEPMALAELYSSLEAIDGYRARARAAAVMHGLGFKAADQERPVGEFSGGWRVRLAMARALCSRADLLLLDEPTNHLDLDAIVWLEEWLGTFAGTLLMISHDREFLDAIIDRVLHIENRTIRAYAGNYSQFEQKRAEELAQLSVLHARQVKRIAEISAFVNRFRASATKSRQAQSRLKMLQRMERIVPAHVDSPFEFEFAKPLKTPRPLITVEDAACGYPGVQVVGGINVSIGPLHRIALLGPNGAGKSTLTRLLAGESAPLSGKRTAAPDLAIGYFAQQQMEQLKLDCDAFWHLRSMGGTDYALGDEQKLRDHLGSFGFQGDRAFEPVARFSGGEKARLTLALLVARRPNLLLLDEPTNHLDIEMRQALTVALQSFEGGLVVVSHDRHLIKSVADTLWLVADGKLQEFAGDLDDYQQWLRSRGKAAPPDEQGPRKKSAAKAPPEKKAVRRDPLARLQQQLAQIEVRLATVAAERALLEAEIAANAADSRLAMRRANLERDAAYLESQWMQIGTAIEAAETERN